MKRNRNGKKELLYVNGTELLYVNRNRLLGTKFHIPASYTLHNINNIIGMAMKRGEFKVFLGNVLM